MTVTTLGHCEIKEASEITRTLAKAEKAAFEYHCLEAFSLAVLIGFVLFMKFQGAQSVLLTVVVGIAMGMLFDCVSNLFYHHRELKSLKMLETTLS